MTSNPFPSLLHDRPRLHLVGGGGAGMRALAEFAADRGCRLSASDASPSRRSIEASCRIGFEIHAGHAARNVPAEAEAVVYSPAVPESNVERVAAASRGLPQASYPAVLGALSLEAPTVAISGTHGKSTTTALLAHVLDAAGLLRGSLCGAEDLGRGRHGWAPADHETGWLVVEACEYRRHFLELSPRVGVVLGIEPDHFDCFSTLKDAESAYVDFIRRIPSKGSLVFNQDCAATRRALEAAETRSKVGFSTTTDRGDWWVENIRQSADSLSFRVVYHGAKEGDITVPILGRQNAANALAAICVSRLLGVSLVQIADSLAAFGGLHRRLERLPDWRGVVRSDDYAHHPTAVRAVLASLREIGGGRRLWCVFQPHQVSRTVALHNEFASAFTAADQTLILPVYGAREIHSAAQVEESRRLAESIRSPGRGEFAPTLDHVRIRLETACRPGDRLVTLGAGDIDRLHDELT